MKLRFPSWQIPELHPADTERGGLSWPEWAALWIGCGLGSGFIKPGPGTWGSILGFIYAGALLRFPFGTALIAVISGLVLSIWSAGVCERILGRKDPGEVVIDEIVSIPFAVWPLLGHPHPPAWLWLSAFVLFRVFDIAKPFPIKQLQCIRGGLGILVDDVVAALFTSAIVWFLL